MDKKEININYIIDIIQKILNKNHTNDNKKKIEIKLSGNKPEINISCPICGDSAKNSHLKRGHLYLNNLYYKCYNEESCSCSFVCFCKKLGVELDIEKKLEIYEHIDATYKYSPKDDYVLTLMDKLIKLDDFLKYCNESGKSRLTNVKPIDSATRQYYYLKNRYISNLENLYEGNLHMSNTWIEPMVVILNRSGDSLLGVELRNLKEDKLKRIYKVMDFEFVNQRVYPTREIDEMEMNRYKQISHLINILNINYENTINVFEGYFDSLFFPNSIGLIGKSTQLDILLDNKADMRFVFDNDKDGIKKTIELMEKGYSVFLWKKLIKDLKIKTHIKDINNLAEYYKNSNIYHDLKLEQYFSRDSFDKIWI